MSEREPVAEQMPTPNNPELTSTITPWAQIRDILVEGGHTWLMTVRPDGRPHVVPVGALWIDGAYIVTTGQGTVKGNNLDHDPHCVISLSVPGFDVGVEGEAAKVSDVGKLERIARVYADQGWPAYVHDGVLDAPFSAATTGPAPYDVYEIAPSVAFAFGTGEETVSRSTRYRF
jgi:hypothetical protein